MATGRVASAEILSCTMWWTDTPETENAKASSSLDGGAFQIIGVHETRLSHELAIHYIYLPMRVPK